MRAENPSLFSSFCAKVTVNRARVLNLRKYMIVGAVVFWLPDIVLHAITKYRFAGWLELIALTLVLPLFSCIAVASTWRSSGDIGKFLAAGLSGVFGI